MTGRLRFLLYIIVLLALSAFFYTPVLWILLLLIVGAIAWGSLFVCSHLFVEARCRTTERGIVLTFDDGPHALTGRVLDILAAHQVKALFFLIGKQAKKHPDIVRRIVAEGHTVGSHTHTHSVRLCFSSTRVVEKDISASIHAIFSITGLQPRLFRPPFGVTNPHIASAVSRLALTTVGWSFRSFDTLFTDSEALKRRLRHIRSGDIVLLHDRMAATVNMLDQWLTELEQQGITIVAPNELFEQGEIYETV